LKVNATRTLFFVAVSASVLHDASLSRPLPSIKRSSEFVHCHAAPFGTAAAAPLSRSHVAATLNGGALVGIDVMPGTTSGVGIGELASDGGVGELTPADIFVGAEVVGAVGANVKPGGNAVGAAVVGKCVGAKVGYVGCAVGSLVGGGVGKYVGVDVGLLVGIGDGAAVGAVGARVGAADGNGVGVEVGAAVGAAVGESVGAGVGAAVGE